MRLRVSAIIFRLLFWQGEQDVYLRCLVPEEIFALSLIFQLNDVRAIFEFKLKEHRLKLSECAEELDAHNGRMSQQVGRVASVSVECDQRSSEAELQKHRASVQVLREVVSEFDTRLRDMSVELGKNEFLYMTQKQMCRNVVDAKSNNGPFYHFLIKHRPEKITRWATPEEVFFLETKLF